METRETARSSLAAGYLIATVGVAGWVVGCFLPIAELGGRNISLFEQISSGPIWNDIGGVLYLFGPISAILVVAILGVLGVIRAAARFLLVGAVVAWSLVSVGVLISFAASFVGGGPGATLDLGYWCCWAGVTVVVSGTAVVLVSERRQDAEKAGVATHEGSQVSELDPASGR